MKIQFIYVFSIFFFYTTAASQNLPSLITEKNINATFSILAYDSTAQEWGIAVATNNIYVGNSTIHIQAGVGAFSVIAETDPDYARNGFDQLQAGKSIQEAILTTKEQDKAAHYRQVSGIDKTGHVFAFTGEALKYWNGQAGHLLGPNYVAMGNQLADSVLIQMAKAFEDAKGTLAERLLASLLAGEAVGGQISGKQSAALVVKGTNNEWFNQIDLRVDHSTTPFQDLQQLLNYHYGRIRLNQSLYAYRAGNIPRAKQKLKEATTLLEGWNGMYAKLAVAQYLIHGADQATATILQAIQENDHWTINLPAFYFLRNHSKLKTLIQPATFTLKDWQNAVQMLIQIGQFKDALALANQTLVQYPESSYLYYQIGQCQQQLGNSSNAKQNLATSLEYDPNNIEAQQLLAALLQPNRKED